MPLRIFRRARTGIEPAAQRGNSLSVLGTLGRDPIARSASLTGYISPPSAPTSPFF